MKKYLKKVLIVLGILAMLFSNAVYAHSGRTDANGGHKDNKNKSGLGSYHYHCGGHPAHLHTNGVCPYSSSSSSSSKSDKSSNSSSVTKSSGSSSSSSSNNKTSTLEPTIINAESIQINENVKEINVGESEELTANIFPTNTTDKRIVWKSSNENILDITESGQITAKGIGEVEIIANTSNGKTDSIKIYVKEKKEENNNVMLNKIADKNNINNIVSNNSEESSPIVGVIVLGAIGGGSYWLYKKLKKDN